MRQDGHEAVLIVNGGASTEESGAPLTDLQMAMLCAEAMGWKHLGAVGVRPQARGEPDNGGLWCLSGANDWWIDPEGHNVCGPCSGIPNPLHDDAQAMALLKRFPMDVFADRGNPFWRVRLVADHNKGYGMADDLNRAIVECVAKLQLDRTARETSTVAQDK